ncbi:MAG: ABC transporter ATP-binding protein [Treponema sp.]|jgi:ATP-binding cassette subfamily B protein/ATP-binding cassette subfamily C protein|nr:ABC transporter ATP-binding protein [Treponema sp.]
MFKETRSILVKLNRLLDRRRKFFLLALFFMTIFLSLIETAGVSVVMPFISVASNPDLIETGAYNYFYRLLRFTDPTGFIMVFGVMIIAFYLFRSLYNIFYTYSLNRFSLGTYRYFAARLFNTYLGLPYKVYVQKNPSVLSQIINNEANNLSTLLQHLLQIFSESFTVLLLYAFMLLVNWQMTMVLTAILLLTVFIVFTTLIRASKKLGEKRYEANVHLSKTLWQTFNNLKFIKLKGNEDDIFEVFNDSTSKISRATVMNSTLGSIPKNILENLGFSLLIAAVCFILWRYNSAAMVIPVISMYALALYRMLPAINRILGFMNSIAYLQRSLHTIYDELNLETDDEGSAPIEFTRSIRGEDLWFSYLEGGEVIKNASFEIRMGEKVAFSGESGSGKTTLIDIIIGIYRPLRGGLYVDDVLIDTANIRSWRSRIGYIPQSIYLFDGTVAENVSFGSELHEGKITDVLKKARIWDFLETKDGIHTLVGEGGIQLSGGQKQRIGIARALYNDPEVLVLDEATSSLDDTTEGEIMDEIYDISGNKTLLIVAHRLSTLERCDRQIRIEDGVIQAG